MGFFQTVNDPASLEFINELLNLFESDGTPDNPVAKQWFLDISDPAHPTLKRRNNANDANLTIGREIPAAVWHFSGSEILDDNNDIIFTVEAPAGVTSAEMHLLGLNFPSWPYTELPEHAHDAGHIHSHTASGNTDNRDLSTHSHSDTFANAATALGSHNHTGVTPNGGDTATEDLGSHGHTQNGSVSNADLGTHYHWFSDTSNTGAPSASGTWATDVTGVDGGTVSTVQKTVFTNTTLEVYATQNIAGGWGSAWGQSGTPPDMSGLFNTNGTGLVDIFSKVAVAGLWAFKFHITDTGKGGKINWLLKFS